ncbi:MAG: PepSY-associated TM helix domain-containing protein, partial [Pseudomonadota bacterium]|nr:PepSY-associated TM helix domain-containing protein [Pseudomonadota bacterium]
GTLLIEHKQGSLLALLNDLHKGRHTGPAWSWLIDISAAVISIFAITGMIILLQHKRYRRAGLSAAFAGTLLPCLYYWLYVPAL